MVREAGLEPARLCGRQDLNLVRLPISPLTHIDVRERRREAAGAFREHAIPGAWSRTAVGNIYILIDLPALVSSRRHRS